jgi:iron complex outermembrane receptor protein
MDDQAPFGKVLNCLFASARVMLIVAALTFSPTVFADEPVKINFNLPSDQFPKAILEFYRQSKIEVLFLADDSLNLIHTKPVVGEYEPREALDIMLNGTGLVYNFATDHSVSIKPWRPLQPPPPWPGSKSPSDSSGTGG